MQGSALPPVIETPVVRYATRNDAFVPAVTWELAGAVLRLADGKGPPREIPLHRAVSLHLAYAPTRPELNRYRCRLKLNHGEVLTCFNRTYKGIYDFQETNVEYITFVIALTKALALYAPACRFYSGESGSSYTLNVLVTIGLLVGLVLLGVFMALVGFGWLLVLKLALMAYYTPALYRWLKRNRPTPFAPEKIPFEVLPALTLDSFTKR